MNLRACKKKEGGGERERERRYVQLKLITATNLKEMKCIIKYKIFCLVNLSQETSPVLVYAMLAVITLQSDLKTVER